MSDSTPEKLDPPLSGKDEKGKAGAIDIEVDPRERTATIGGSLLKNVTRGTQKPGDTVTVITGGHETRILGVPVTVNVVVTIDGRRDPATIRIEAFKAGKRLKNSVFTIAREEQHRLVPFVRRLVPEDKAA